MAAKLGKIMTYLECLLPIKLNDYIVAWSCKIYIMNKIYNVR